MKSYKDTDFLHSTARVRAMENTMLDAKALMKMVDAKNAEEAFKTLAESAIGQGCELAEYEQAFQRNLLESYELVAAISPAPGLADIFRCKYDGHNLKVAIKARKLDRDYSGLYSALGTVPAERLVRELDSHTFTDLAPQLATAALLAEEQLAKTGDPQAVDITIDKAVLEVMADTAKKLENSFITTFVQARIDIANLRAAVRLQRMRKELPMLRNVIAEGGALSVERLCEAYARGLDGVLELIASLPCGTMLEPSFEDLRAGRSLSRFDKLCDNYLVSLFDRVRYIPFGIEPLAAYLFGKEWETNAARIVLASKLAGVPPEQITERLRDAYA